MPDFSAHTQPNGQVVRLVPRTYVHDKLSALCHYIHPNGTELRVPDTQQPTIPRDERSGSGATTIPELTGEGSSTAMNDYDPPIEYGPVGTAPPPPSHAGLKT